MANSELGTRNSEPTPAEGPAESFRVPRSAFRVVRDPALRAAYLRAALPHIPRLLGAIDRNPFRATYGCLDRQFWHYRTADFASEMCQEGVLALALVYRHAMPGNRWHGQPRIRELALAALRYSARSGRRDGSCDDYYPYERALGAAVFSLVAAAETCQVLQVDERAIVGWLVRRARWVADHGESGRLANHHALAALGLELAARVTGRREFHEAAAQRLRTVLAWQSPEGWFDEYGGADPGYQTVTIDALARYRRLTRAEWLDEPLARAVAFARHFLHPDDSFGGEYCSRGTFHYYPHGMELLAADNAAAAELAEAHLRSLEAGRAAAFEDDRLFAHRTAGWIGAWLDWAGEMPTVSPLRPPLPPGEGWGEGAPTDAGDLRSDVSAGSGDPRRALAGDPRRALAPPGVPRSTLHAPRSTLPSVVHFPHARLVVRRDGPTHTIVSLARGGVFKHFAPGRPPVTDAGLMVELDDGRIAVSQSHDLGREVETRVTADGAAMLAVSGPLHLARFETATPWTFVVFRLVLLSVGRLLRTFVRRLLQRRLITGRRQAPIRLTRTIELLPATTASGGREPPDYSAMERPPLPPGELLPQRSRPPLPPGEGWGEGDGGIAPDLRSADAAGSGDPRRTGGDPRRARVRLRVTDMIELTHRRVRVRRMAFGTDHQAAYVAASGVYQDSVLEPWTDLAAHVAELNAHRRVTIIREYE